MTRTSTLTTLIEAAKRATPGPWQLLDEWRALAEKAIEREAVAQKAIKDGKSPHEYFGVAELRNEALWQYYKAIPPEMGIALITALEQSQRDLEGARKALKPFSDEAKDWSDMDFGGEFLGEGTMLTVDHLRAAAKELEGET